MGIVINLKALYITFKDSLQKTVSSLSVQMPQKPAYVNVHKNVQKVINISMA